ncbi:hypothetical protein GA0061098_1004203 [Bradyrhizobium shewense]|uniref:Oligosaccharide repeat unit polymerase n=1 Tax=Bradyrhizobium shewense TaxID=1761772 RepID=A0A1C3VGM9_9BRAD|nr:hypothetical protein [Bradyrhizobium shewense]SCB26891.1 hypothetical protein GA0061098_1004203 [Bradyrhizobium shewense]
MIELALVFQVAIFALAMHFAISSRRFHLGDPLFYYLVFHGIFFVLRPIAVHLFDLRFVVNRIGFELSDELFVWTLLCSDVGLIAWLAVGATVRGIGKNQLREVSALLSRTPHEEQTALFVAIAILGPIALYSAYIGIEARVLNGSGEAGLVLDQATGVTINSTSTGYLNDAQYMLGSLVLLSMVCLKGLFVRLAILAAFLIVRLSIGNDRWTVVFLLCSLGILTSARRGNYRIPLWVYLAAVPAFAIFTLLGEARYFIRDLFFGTALSSGQPAEVKTIIDRLNGPDIANFEFLAFIVNTVPDRTGTYSYFAQWLQLFTEPIPRILWADKPVGAPISLFSLNHYGNFFFYSRGMIGDAYMSLGIPGVVIVAGVFGRLISATARKLMSGGMGKPGVVLGIVILPLTIQWLRDGGVVQITKFVMWNSLPVLLWSFARSQLKKKRRLTRLRGVYQ